MRVLVDTSIWSLAVRRKTPSAFPATGRHRQGLGGDHPGIAGCADRFHSARSAVGAAHPAVFDRLREHLRAFDDEPLTCEDYEEAARCFNVCRRAGITGSTVDFLLCAVAVRRRLEIFTTDADFHNYAKHLPFRLHKSRVAGL